MSIKMSLKRQHIRGEGLEGDGSITEGNLVTDDTEVESISPAQVV